MNIESHLNRRGFLQTAAGVALAAGALAQTRTARAAEKRKPWIVACRDPLLKISGKPDCWSAMKELGVAGVEIEATPDLACPGLYHPQKKYSIATADGIKALQADLAEQGLSITAFLMHNRLDEQLERELAWTRKLVAAAQQLGFAAIRIDVVPSKLRREEFLPFAIKACKQLCEIAEGTPVHYGIENHGGVTNDPDFLDRLFEGVGSAQLGLTLDTANFYWYGHPLDDLYRIYEKYAPRVVHTHCKSIKYPAEKQNVRREMGWQYDTYACPIYEGDIDFQKLVGILRRANYRGDLCLEDESLDRFPKEQRADILKREIALLRQLA